MRATKLASIGYHFNHVMCSLNHPFKILVMVFNIFIYFIYLLYFRHYEFNFILAVSDEMKQALSSLLLLYFLPFSRWTQNVHGYIQTSTWLHPCKCYHARLTSPKTFYSDFYVSRGTCYLPMCCSMLLLYVACFVFYLVLCDQFADCWFL